MCFFFFHWCSYFSHKASQGKTQAKEGQNVIVANNIMSKNMNKREENIGHHMEQCHE
jgi:hypothetical protein